MRFGTAEEINQLIEQQVEEGATLDFKSALSNTNETDGNQWDKDARAMVSKAVCAFANADGGSLIIGIEETKDKPNRARGLRNIKGAHGLASQM